MKFTDLKLSIAEEFVILNLLGKEMFKSKKLKIGNTKIYSITAIFIYLLLEDKISLNEKQQLIINDLNPTGVKYIDIILKTINSSKKAKKIDEWIEYFYVHLKLCNDIYNTIVEDILNKNILELKNKDGFLTSSKKDFKDIYNIGDCIIQKIRAELLEDGEIDDNTIYLTLILDANKMLTSYFSEYEYKILKENLEKLYESKEAKNFKLIKKTISSIEMYSTLNLFSDIISGLV
ncbi:GPP34 family phosphoprotein [Clostridium mediterraneense]|uniref:GPP34 family phosphoprotein n=1 Tax=Clostridium mediterraneense TaxID=1805472 RepID=UPI00082BCB9A|nr:GPP34 family phosphoprotein [Clostridium mediterraneense]